MNKRYYTQRGVVQARWRVFPGDPPEGLRGSLADAPQKFEQVDGSAEPAVAVDQGPEEQGPDRDHQAGEAIPQPRHRAAATAGSAALPRRGEQRRALRLQSETASAAARQPLQPVRGSRLRARLPAGPRASVPGAGPVSQPRAPALTVSSCGHCAQPRSAASQTHYAATSAPD